MEKIRWGRSTRQIFFSAYFCSPSMEKYMFFAQANEPKKPCAQPLHLFSYNNIAMCLFFWKHISPNRKTNFSSFSRLIFLFSVPLSSFSHPFLFPADVEPIWRWRSDGTQKGVTKSRAEIYRQRKLMWKYAGTKEQNRRGGNPTRNLNNFSFSLPTLCRLWNFLSRLKDSRLWKKFLHQMRLWSAPSGVEV